MSARVTVVSRRCTYEQPHAIVTSLFAPRKFLNDLPAELTVYTCTKETALVFDEEVKGFHHAGTEDHEGKSANEDVRYFVESS